jgi:hypothetical protein
LFPGRGAGLASSAEFSSVVGASFAGGVGMAAAARWALIASRSTPSSAANSAASAGSTSTFFFAALFLAAAFLTGFFSSAGFASG